MASTLVAMASNLQEMASNLIAMATRTHSEQRMLSHYPVSCQFGIDDRPCQCHGGQCLLHKMTDLEARMHSLVFEVVRVVVAAVSRCVL